MNKISQTIKSYEWKPVFEIVDESSMKIDGIPDYFMIDVNIRKDNVDANLGFTISVHSHGYEFDCCLGYGFEDRIKGVCFTHKIKSANLFSFLRDFASVVEECSIDDYANTYQYFSKNSVKR